MNLKELIKKCESIAEDETNNGLTRGFYKAILDDLKNLDEVAKVEIPQCAIDIIENAKERGYTLFGAMNVNYKSKEFRDWIETTEHQELFARAWIEGYEVEEEKEERYLVKLNATNQYLHVDNFIKASFSSQFKTEVTKTMLDNLGLSEVFRNPLFEVEEVK